MGSRAILHVDMDAFYAAVEQRDRPELRGKPVIVGADPAGRGVVAAASYEARRYGIHSAMPIDRAYRLCPQGVYLPVDMPKYVRESAQIMRVLGEFTPLVEPLSLDEAFLDITASQGLFGPAVAIARTVKARIKAEVGLTASAGVAPNKFLAKIASGLRKPDGLVEVRPGEEAAFLRDLPIPRLWGVGPAAEAALAGLGVRTVGQLAWVPRRILVDRFGATGAHLWMLAQGRDDRPVVPWQEPKSVGAEETFERDTDDARRLRVTLLAQADRVAAELRGLGLCGRTVTLKLRFADFRTVTRRETSTAPTADGGEIFRRAWSAFTRLPRPQPIRLIGLSVAGLNRDTAPRQLSLFGRTVRVEQVGRLADELRARFGPNAVRRASLLVRPGPT
ncbi:MAG: DNA polymerase IV [Candidatus Rokubacteria bacterium]|nr:DNA polymerase IV [Candidatus Rokubacteria bacterium]